MTLEELAKLVRMASDDELAIFTHNDKDVTPFELLDKLALIGACRVFNFPVNHASLDAGKLIESCVANEYNKKALELN